MSDKEPKDWHVEHNFWFTKFQRAFIRFEDALKRGDGDGMKEAQKQMDLYSHRMELVMPAELKAEIEKEQEQERRLAMEGN